MANDFQIKLGDGATWYNALSTFAQGYVEAMAFADANEDQGPEFTDWHVGKLTLTARNDIMRACTAFETQAHDLLALAYATDAYDATQAGRDFYFTRQGHGVGYWDRSELAIPAPDGDGDGTLGDALSAVARTFGEAYHLYS